MNVVLNQNFNVDIVIENLNRKKHEKTHISDTQKNQLNNKATNTSSILYIHMYYTYIE